MIPANPIKRLLAFILDSIVVLALLMLLTFSITFIFKVVSLKTGIPFFNLFSIIQNVQIWTAFLTIIGYTTISNWYWGGTVGKAIFDLRVVNFEGKPITLKASLFRSLSYILSLWTYGISFVIGLIRKDSLCLHDFASNTKVCSIRYQHEVLKHNTPNQIKMSY